MSNSSEILKELGKLCPGDHIHQHLVSGCAEQVAVYPEGLCRAICRGLVKQIEIEKGQIRHLLNLSSTDVVQQVPDDEENQNQWQEAWDDTSGKELDPSGVRAARALEIEHVNAKKVWRKIPRAEARRQGCKMIGTRWVDIDKGDDEKPDYRSRLVAKEFNNGQEEGLYASTPPLEALRWILSHAATIEHQSRKSEDKVILIADVSRAFFEAPIHRRVAVKLPKRSVDER